MSYLTSNQPDGTPTWIDLGIPDLDRAMEFYGAVFGWEFVVGSQEYGRYTTCLLDGRPAAGLAPNLDPDATAFWWNVYLATGDCDATAQRAEAAGAVVVMEPTDIGNQGRMALIRDPVGAQFGLWQGGAHIGCQVVNEPNALVRNDLVTADAAAAREFYAAVFGFTLDGNDDLPDLDFTFLRRPDGHEIGGIIGAPGVPSAWGTAFEVADTDATVARVASAGGSASTPQDMIYGRFADVTDPFGAPFTVIARPGAARSAPPVG